jgi:hypothetical protein
MAGLVLLAVAWGIAISPQGHGLRRATRLAAYSLILSGVCSAAGVYLWHGAGAIDPQYTTAGMLGAVFGVHSAWGWVLLLTSFRL